jgi:hypothetical protein
VNAIQINYLVFMWNFHKFVVKGDYVGKISGNISDPVIIKIVNNLVSREIILFISKNLRAISPAFSDVTLSEKISEI